jgi:hypothetical protein
MSNFESQRQELEKYGIGTFDDVPQDILKYLKRMAICIKCPNLIPYVKICKICKCVMPIKVRLKEMICPEKKW